MAKPGGWSAVKDATPEIQKICDEMKTVAEKEVGQNFDVFTAKRFAEQVVNGKNYIIKVFTGENKYLHLMVFQDLPGNGGKLKLLGWQYPKTKDDPLKPWL